MPVPALDGTMGIETSTATTAPALGSPPGGAPETPDLSPVVIFSDGIRQRVKTYTDCALATYPRPT